VLVLDQKVQSCLWSIRGNFPRFDGSIKSVLTKIIEEVIIKLYDKTPDEILSICKDPTFWQRYQLRRICRKTVRNTGVEGVYEPFKFHEALLALGRQISLRDLKTLISEVNPEQVLLTMEVT
jgi:hypothetical protein